jgi:hypothetical protein
VVDHLGNRVPGAVATRDWHIRKVGAEHEIEGYADQVSVLPGESFRLFVSTTARGFTVEAFRMGWYGGRRLTSPCGPMAPSPRGC